MIEHDGQVIAYPGDRPPCLVPPPCDFRGAVWHYADATPENARVALEAHRRNWPDWQPDADLIRLAAGDRSAAEAAQ